MRSGWFARPAALVNTAAYSACDAGAATDACTGVHKWTAPIAVKGRIVVAGDNHLCSWSPH